MRSSVKCQSCGAVLDTIKKIGYAKNDGVKKEFYCRKCNSAGRPAPGARPLRWPEARSWLAG